MTIQTTIGIDDRGIVVEDLKLATVIYKATYEDTGELISEKTLVGKGAKIPSYVVSKEKEGEE